MPASESQKRALKKFNASERGKEHRRVYMRKKRQTLEYSTLESQKNYWHKDVIGVCSECGEEKRLKRVSPPSICHACYMRQYRAKKR